MADGPMTTCAVCGEQPVRVCRGDWPEPVKRESKHVALCGVHERQLRRMVKHYRRAPYSFKLKLGDAARSERHCHDYGKKIAQAVHAANVRWGNV